MLDENFTCWSTCGHSLIARYSPNDISPWLPSVNMIIITVIIVINIVNKSLNSAGSSLLRCICFKQHFLKKLGFWFSPTLASMYYRVSQKKVSLRFCTLSRPPRGLKIPSLTFFSSPFCVDSRNIHFVIIWWNFYQDIAKILQGSHFKS